jgi:hypothetical protein
MKIMLCLASEEPKDFKDIFKGATQELQAIAERRTAKMFPPFVMPDTEPDFTADELIPNQRNRIDVSKYRDPKYGFFGESFARILDNERARGGTPDGPKTEES